MRWIATLVLLVTAVGCEDGERPPSRPPTGTPGGGGGQSTPAAPDAAPGDAQAGQEIRGSLCPVTDLRSPESCADVDVSGADVTERVGDRSTTAGPAGDFAVASPGGELGLLAVGLEDPALRGSLLEVLLAEGAASGVSAPVIPQATYDELTAALGVSEPNGTASLAVYVQGGGGPVQGAELIPPDGATFSPFYDTALGPTAWDQDALTGPAGAALVFGVSTGVGPVTFTIVGPGGAPVVTVPDVPVEAEATTFVFVSLE